LAPGPPIVYALPEARIYDAVTLDAARRSPYLTRHDRSENCGLQLRAIGSKTIAVSSFTIRYSVSANLD